MFFDVNVCLIIESHGKFFIYSLPYRQSYIVIPVAISISDSIITSTSIITLHDL